MGICIACGINETDNLNFYKEPLCIPCQNEIVKEGKEAFEEICREETHD